MAIGAGLIIAMGALVYFGSLRYVRQMGIPAARAGAMRLAQAVEVYQVLFGFPPVEARYNRRTDADGDYENRDIVRQLTNVMVDPAPLRVEPSERNEKGSFIDPWGRPYRVLFWKEKPGDAICRHFQVYSCGPNRSWEMGAGDDIKPRR